LAIVRTDERANGDIGSVTIYAARSSGRV